MVHYDPYSWHIQDDPYPVYKRLCDESPAYFVAQRNLWAITRYADCLRRFWFDTVLYNKESLELLFKIVGPDCCLFGTERPGSGSAIDPVTGRSLDDLRPIIEEISFLSPTDKAAIFEGNARTFYSRLDTKER